MSSPRPPLLLLDVVPKSGLLRSTRSGNDTIAHLRRHIATLRSMAPVDETGVALTAQRLPSTRSIDKRWDRSRNVILRTAERNVLRDFRWTVDDPVTFTETPGRSREYATRRVIGGKPQATSSQDQAAQGDVMDNTHAIDLDPTFTLRQQLKGKDAQIRTLREEIESAVRAVEKRKDDEHQALKDENYLIKRGLDKRFKSQMALLDARYKKHDEREVQLNERDKGVVERERDVTIREETIESTIADAETKALQDAQDAVKGDQRALQNERDDFRRTKEEEEAVMKSNRERLKTREESIEVVVANARDEARMAEEAAYDKRYQILEKNEETYKIDRADMERSKASFATILANSTAADRKALERDQKLLERDRNSLKQAWTYLGRQKTGFDAMVADAREAAKKEVDAECEGLLESALQKESDAARKLKEADALQDDAIKIKDEAIQQATKTEQDAVRTAARIKQEANQKAEFVWRRHGEAASSSEKEHMQMFATHKDILRKERALEHAKFRNRLPNAEYREQVERQNYDSYQEIWDKVTQSHSAFHYRIQTVYLSQREQVERWGVLAEQFDGSNIHPSFPSRYRVLCERIQEHLRSSQLRAKNAAERTKQGRATLIMGALRSVQLQSHYSRLLTRFHRFEGYQGQAGTAEVMNHVFKEGPLQELREKLETRKIEIETQLEAGGNTGDSSELRAELVDVENRIARIKDESRASAVWRRFESLKILRHDSMQEKEIAVSTNDSGYWINQATKTFNDLQSRNPGVVVDSEVSDDVQRRERDAILQRLRGARKDLAKYHTFIREKCVLEQQLGEVEAHNARLDAAIDREIEDIRPRVLKQARNLAGLPPPSPSRARPLAFRATRRPVTPVKARTALFTPPWTGQIAKEPEHVNTIPPEVWRMTAQLVHRLKENTTYSNAHERAEDEAKLKRLKREAMMHSLYKLKKSRSALLDDPKADRVQLSQLDKNISGVEKSLAAGSSGTLRPPKPGRITRAQRRAARAATSAQVSPSSKLDSPPTATSEGGKVTAAPALNLRATASQQAWQPLGIDRLRYLHTNELKTKDASSGKVATVLSRMLNKPLEHQPFAPMALHVYSLHTLHTSAGDEQIRPDAEDSFRTPPNSDSSIVDSFDASIELSQSTAEAISDPESDDSYDPSESGDSVGISETADSIAEAPDVEVSSSLPSTQEFADAPETQPLETAFPAAVVEQTDTQMTYNISTEDYRRAALASQSTNTAFWSYKLYKNAEGKTPSIHYCTNFETAEAQAKQFVDEAVLGFDLEWESGTAAGKSSIKKSVSLVQIASETKIGLFQLAMFKGEKAEELMPPSLRQILESRAIAKAGVNISGDATRIEKCFGFKMQGIFELSHLYNVVTWSETAPGRVNKKLFKLADQVQNVLLLPMKKDSVRTSAWSRRLRPEQAEYAASDAYAGLRIYHALEARRKKMRPTPPRPAFWEDKKPLVLGDGKVVVPRTVVKKKPVEAGKSGDEGDEDDDESEEYFDAVETLDPYQIDSTAGVPLEGLSISYPALPPVEDNVDEPQPAAEQPQPQASIGEPSTAVTTPSETAKAPSKPRPAVPSSPAVTAADSWSETFRNSLPINHNLKTKHATLRAYHLWHHQSLECKDVAALLRDPPLSVMTVASYVLQAISGENQLECRRDRVVATLEILPASARGRYYRVVERVERAEVAREVERDYW